MKEKCRGKVVCLLTVLILRDNEQTIEKQGGAERCKNYDPLKFLWNNHQNKSKKGYSEMYLWIS